MQIDKDTMRAVLRLTSDDGKMLLLDNQYYCELTSSQKSREVPAHYSFFSENWKEENSPTFTQYTDCFVLDTDIGKGGHHAFQYGKLYHSKHVDLDIDSFSLMLSTDNMLVPVSKIEIVDKPYPLQKLIDLIDKDILPKDYVPEDGDPMMTLDGVAFIDFGHIGSKFVGLEYYITGKLYVEIVDFSDVPDGGIVQLDDMQRREVLVNMPVAGDKLSESNVKDIAALINTRVKEEKKSNKGVQV